MRNLPLGLALHATVSVTEIVQPRRAPTPPAVIPRRCGTGQSLPDLPVLAQATGPVMPLDPTRVDDVVTEERQAGLEAGCAMPDPHLYARNTTPCIVFCDLPLGYAWRPAPDRAPGPACGARRGDRLATAAGVEDG